uniref:N-myc 2 proto-oncogene protein n=1 Tax=Lygus hesperus TaxID=30085 RepID=A0A0A9WKM7_LYGHE
MAAVSRQVKTEVIELSDSDELGAPQHVASEWVRRSSRPRKASVRFSPDDEPTTSTRVVGAKSQPRRSATTEEKRLRTSESSSDSSNCSSGYGMELIDPQVLITYVEKFKRKIRTGQFGINMPVGPDEFVLVDAVDYLRNLGYSDFEIVEEEEENEFEEEEEQEEDEEQKTEFTVEYKNFKEEVLFEPQAAVKMEVGNSEDSHESDEKLQEINFWDKLQPHPFTPGSLNQDSSDVPSNKSTDENIDVEKVDLTAFYLRQANAKKLASIAKIQKRKSSISKRPRKDDDEKDDSNTKEKHNEMERLRRVELATQFRTLATLVYSAERSDRVPKVKILSSAVETLTELKRTQVHLQPKKNPCNIPTENC